ncbi:conserved hypothetical protein [Theileria orientalis strain Shintoku]|uniref:SfiI-subtelomeric related protein family member n=1 Tax=Theileria orientalis strain Shintoku TaxID=869250 RepID=J4CCN6_THEOR|nr:conserved hypothetical protein [Theileria orientalis strain Shintoku]BAM39707.1 conserved hypothetical protein [Theileria orientalis strain Shintoku]|eukprot:XP_009690008.1 conserved hypothetical protein [Theileria orientalis strain Shintoku]
MKRPLIVLLLLCYGYKIVKSEENSSVDCTLFKVRTEDTSEDCGYKDNDTSKYSYELKGLFKNQPLYTFNTGVKLVALLYNDEFVWKHTSAHDSSKFPTELEIDPYNKTLWVKYGGMDFVTFKFENNKWKHSQDLSYGDCKRVTIPDYSDPSAANAGEAEAGKDATEAGGARSLEGTSGESTKEEKGEHQLEFLERSKVTVHTLDNDGNSHEIDTTQYTVTEETGFLQVDFSDTAKLHKVDYDGVTVWTDSTYPCNGFPKRLYLNLKDNLLWVQSDVKMHTFQRFKNGWEVVESESECQVLKESAKEAATEVVADASPEASAEAPSVPAEGGESAGDVLLSNLYPSDHTGAHYSGLRGSELDEEVEVKEHESKEGETKEGESGSSTEEAAAVKAEEADASGSHLASEASTDADANEAKEGQAAKEGEEGSTASADAGLASEDSKSSSDDVLLGNLYPSEHTGAHYSGLRGSELDEEVEAKEHETKEGEPASEQKTDKLNPLGGRYKMLGTKADGAEGELGDDDFEVEGDDDHLKVTLKAEVKMKELQFKRTDLDNFEKQWERDQEKHGDAYPKVLDFGVTKSLVTVEFGPRWFYKYNNGGMSPELEVFKAPLDASKKPALKLFRLVEDNNAEKEMEEADYHLVWYFDSANGQFHRFEFDEGTKMVKLEYNNEELWKHDSAASAGKYPKYVAVNAVRKDLRVFVEDGVKFDFEFDSVNNKYKTEADKEGDLLFSNLYPSDHAGSVYCGLRVTEWDEEVKAKEPVAGSSTEEASEASTDADTEKAEPAKEDADKAAAKKLEHNGKHLKVFTLADDEVSLEEDKEGKFDVVVEDNKLVVGKFNAGAKCVKLEYDGKEVWKHEEAKHGTKHPSEVRFNTDNLEVVVAFEEDKSKFTFKHDSKSNAHVLAHSFLPLDVSERPDKVKFYKDAAAAQEIGNADLSLSKESDGQKEFMVHRFNNGAKCHLVKYEGKDVWEYDEEYADNFPASVHYNTDDHELRVFVRHNWYYFYKFDTTKNEHDVYREKEPADYASKE